MYRLRSAHASLLHFPSLPFPPLPFPFTRPGPLLAAHGWHPHCCMPFRACSVFSLALCLPLRPAYELQRFAPPSSRLPAPQSGEGRDGRNVDLDPLPALETVLLFLCNRLLQSAHITIVGARCIAVPWRATGNVAATRCTRPLCRPPSRRCPASLSCLHPLGPRATPFPRTTTRPPARSDSSPALLRQMLLR